jgi:hypothetical protein
LRVAYLSAWKNVVWSPPLVALEILQIHKLSLSRPIGESFRELVFL